MSHIVIKRPNNHRQWSGQQAAVNDTRPKVDRLAKVGEIKHGIKGQCMAFDDSTAQFTLRKLTKQLNYLTKAKEKNLDFQGSFFEQGAGGRSQKDRIKNEQMARKGYDAFMKHIVNYIQNAKRHGRASIEIDVAETLDSFRRYRAPNASNPLNHTRNLAMWLQEMVRSNGGQNVHTVLGRAIVKGLRNAGYITAKIETRYKKQIVKTPIIETQRNAFSLLMQGNTQVATKTISFPYDIISVSTTPEKKAHLDNLNPKTQAAIRHKIPSWIGSIFEG